MKNTKKAKIMKKKEEDLDHKKANNIKTKKKRNLTTKRQTKRETRPGCSSSQAGGHQVHLWQVSLKD